MNVFVEPSNRRIAPFDDPAGEAPVTNRPLHEWLDDAIRDAGLTRIDSLQPPCLVVPDNLFATAGALRRFIDEAAGRDAFYVLGKSEFGASITPVQPDVTATEAGWRFEKIRWVSGSGSAPVDVVIDPEERLIDMPIPRAFLREGEQVKLGVPKHAVATVHHWSHLLLLNHLARGIELQQGPRWKLAGRIAGAVLKSFSTNKWKVMGKLNRIAKGCEIHPTAVVEASTLAKGVKVGPFARVFMSNLAEGAEVMAQASVEMSSVGAHASVAQNCVVRLCVLYPEAVAAQDVIQKSVIGRRAVLTSGSYTFDVNFENDIRVELDGGLHSSGSRFLGSAFGHESRVATGIYLASGREIPNGCKIIRDPASVLGKIPKDLPEGGQVRVVGNRVEPV